MGAGTEEGSVKSKSAVRADKTETNEFDLDGDLFSVSKEMESTAVKQVSPDAFMGMFAIEFVLKGNSLAIVVRRNIFHKR